MILVGTYAILLLSMNLNSFEGAYPIFDFLKKFFYSKTDGNFNYFN